MANDIFKSLSSNGQDTLQVLKRYRQQTRSFINSYEANLKIADAINKNAIEKMGNLAKDFSTVRNTGAAFLCSSAGVIGGVAGGVGLAAGATLKGVGKFHETGNVGAAVVETASEVLVYCCGIKAGMTGASAAKEFFFGIAVKAPADLCKSYVSGDSLPKAMASALFETIPLGAAKGKLQELVKKAPCTAIVKTTDAQKLMGEAMGETIQSTTMEQTKNYALNPKASNNLKFVDDGYLNFKASPAEDERFVKRFCLHPAPRR